MAKILLLEDDTSLNRGISLKLEKEGYKMLSAFRVSQAEEMFREHEVSLIISDITMEDGDGLEFCRSIRRVSDVHLIFLTALDQEVDIVNGLRCRSRRLHHQAIQPDGSDLKGQRADAQDRAEPEGARTGPVLPGHSGAVPGDAGL